MQPPAATAELRSSQLPQLCSAALQATVLALASATTHCVSQPVSHFPPPFRHSDLHCAGFPPQAAAAAASFKGRGWVGLGMELEMGRPLGAIFVEHDVQGYCLKGH